MIILNNFRSLYRIYYNRIVSFKSQWLKKYEMIQTKKFQANLYNTFCPKNYRKELASTIE